MKNSVLKEYVESVRARATAPECEDKSPEADYRNMMNKGYRMAMNTVANELMLLIDIFQD